MKLFWCHRQARIRVDRHSTRILFLAGLLLSSALPTQAEIKVDDPDRVQVTEPCDFELIAEGSLHQNGLSLLGETIQVVGDLFKISYRFGPNCPKITVTDLPFDWTFEPPDNSSAVLQGGSPSDEDPLNPHFVPDVEGTYRVTLTYCRATCVDEPIPGQSIPPQLRSITISVVHEIVVPPASEPELPPSARVPTNFFSGSGDEACLTRDELNAVFPQWVPTEHWDGADDYVWLEGAVVKANVAGKDGEINHITHDLDFAVDPDPTFQGVANRVTVGVEWETGSFPDATRPLPGDRISPYGFHVWDCDHDDILEIHPPVVTAVQRPRPIAIPESLGLGSNIYVPGIVTDIYANKTAGEITSNRSLSGLHQPGHYDFLIVPVPGAPIENPHPLDRTGGFVFNVYLPPNPAKLMAEGGRTAAPAPLYCVVGNQPCADVQPAPGSPEPVVTPVSETDSQTGEQFTYLRVTLDLSTLEGFDYSRRITAGWVYPAPEAVADNWGLSRYKVQIDSITVIDSQDALQVDHGDWRFWVAVNNVDKVWTQILNQDVEGGGETEDFGGRPWATGPTDPERSLGSHILLFPTENPPRFSRDLSRRVFVHSSGYDDEFWDDPIGVVNDLLLQSNAVSQSPHHSLSRSEGAYTLNYQVFALGSVGPEVLTAEGSALSQRFTLRPSETGLCTPVGPLCLLLPAFNKLSDPWHPADVRLSPGDPPLVWSDQRLFRPQAFEWHTELTMEELRANIETVRELYPERAEGYVAELRDEFDLVQATLLESDYRRALLPLEIATPPDLWVKHLGAPTATVQGGQCLSDTSASARVQLLVEDLETPAGDLAVTATSSNPELIPDGNLALEGSGAARTLTFSAIPKKSGSATISVTVSDGSDSAMLQVAVQVGTTVTDALTGGAGADVLFGLAGKNTLHGEGGNDLLCGGNAPDALDGGGGNDVLQGGRGNDSLAGGDGDDTLLGENGDDSLVGQNGTDALTGGSGADAFSGGPGPDTNNDFNSAQGDTQDGT